MHVPAELEPSVPGSARLQTHALHRAATGIGLTHFSLPYFTIMTILFSLFLAIGLLRADSKSVWLDQTSKDFTGAMFAVINTQTHKLPTRNVNLCTFIIYLSIRFPTCICSNSTVIVNRLKYHVNVCISLIRTIQKKKLNKKSCMSF
jgi:hypothetical protein